MEEFVSIDILATMAGCSLIITLATQICKRFIPEKIDTKWLALVFSIIIGVLRIVYVGQFDFAGIVSGIFNIGILLGTAIGIYEIASPTVSTVVDKLKDFMGGK